MEALCVTQGLSLPTAPGSEGLSNIPRAKKRKNYLFNVSSHGRSSSVWFRATGLWSLLSLSLCSSEVGWTKSIAGLCPQLPGTVYSSYTQPFSKDKTSFQLQGLRKKKSLWYKQWEKQIQFKEIKIDFPKTTEVLQVLGEDIVGDCSTLTSLGAD